MMRLAQATSILAAPLMSLVHTILDCLTPAVSTPTIARMTLRYFMLPMRLPCTVQTCPAFPGIPTRTRSHKAACHGCLRWVCFQRPPQEAQLHLLQAAVEKSAVIHKAAITLVVEADVLAVAWDLAELAAEVGLVWPAPHSKTSRRSAPQPHVQGMKVSRSCRLSFPTHVFQ